MQGIEVENEGAASEQEEEKEASYSLAAFSVSIMAPLDLDKYVEIARQCKYLPENDLKVSRSFWI